MRSAALELRPEVAVRSWSRLLPLTALLAGFLAGSSAAPLAAQPKGQAPPPGDEIPKPQTLSLPTHDGQTVKATYYPGVREKESVPVVLLHGLGGNRLDFIPLAQELQRRGYACVVPDLRGHGESATLRDAAGRTVKVTPDDLRLPDLMAMVSQDVEAVKKFLVGQNNAGKLNVEKLCLVGADLGASVALNFAARDWSFQRLPNLKQGQDVKAVVLISPQWDYKGFGIAEALAHPAIQTSIDVEIIVGNEQARALADARRLYRRLARYRGLEASGQAEDDYRAAVTLIQAPTPEQGIKLLNLKGGFAGKAIDRFLDLHVLRANIPWVHRRRVGEQQ
jgi:pimeloyl-ACP methyl ester carboxylesterase